MTKTKHMMAMALASLLLGATPGVAKAEAPAKAGAQARTTKVTAKSLGKLRTDCYGGRNEGELIVASNHWEQELLGATARQQHDRIAHWARRILEDGGDETEFVPLLIKATEEGDLQGRTKTVKACVELLRALEDTAPQQK